jgi:hypothetical protein
MGVQTTVHLALSLLWIAVLSGVGIAALSRFRTTATGLLVGGSCATGAVKTLAVTVLHYTVGSSLPFDHPAQVAILTLSLVISAATMAGVAVGIALLPSSLRRLGG